MNRPLILIIESDEWLAEQYQRVLGVECRTMVAHNALAAMKLIDKIIPDLIVVDILLTGGTAFALLHELQSYGDTGSIPIILCTNLASELSIESLRSYGVKVILDKTLMVPSDLPSAARDILA